MHAGAQCSKAPLLPVNLKDSILEVSFAVPDNDDERGILI